MDNTISDVYSPVSFSNDTFTLGIEVYLQGQSVSQQGSEECQIKAIRHLKT